MSLGLALQIQARFPVWGGDFSTLVISVVVMNQLLGPVLCKLGLAAMREFHFPKGSRLERGRKGGGSLSIVTSKAISKGETPPCP